MTFRFAHGRAPKPSFLWFRDFGTCPRAPKPIILSLETPGDVNKIKKLLGTKNQNHKSWNVGNMFSQISNRQAPKNPDAPSNKILQIFDMMSISIKIMKWKFGNWAKFSTTGKDVLIFETKKPRNAQTKKPRLQESKKPWHQETSKTKKP